MTRYRYLALGLCAAPILVGCGNVQEVTDNVNNANNAALKVKDCATLAADISRVQLSKIDRASAEQAATRLNEHVAQIDSADVKSAAETLATRVKELAVSAATSNPTKIAQSVEKVRTASAKVASTCNVPTEQFLGGN